MAPRTRFAVPLLVTVTVCGPDVAPTATLPNGTDGGLTKITGPPPVPLSVTVDEGRGGIVRRIVSVALFAPLLVGLNRSPIVHDCVGASVAPVHRSCSRPS